MWSVDCGYTLFPSSTGYIGFARFMISQPKRISMEARKSHSENVRAKHTRGLQPRLLKAGLLHSVRLPNRIVLLSAAVRHGDQRAVNPELPSRLTPHQD